MVSQVLTTASQSARHVIAPAAAPAAAAPAPAAGFRPLHVLSQLTPRAAATTAECAGSFPACVSPPSVAASGVGAMDPKQ
jgi:hypothetical protein